MSADEATLYTVVINHEEQYSIWPADREYPPGWTAAGKSGTKQECLAYINEIWTDMRPLTLRQRMEEASVGRAGMSLLSGYDLSSCATAATKRCRH